MKHRKTILLITCIIFFLIPFLWLAPGEMDLGGDSTRLYFYDPLNYLQNMILYVLLPVGFKGTQSPQIAILPYDVFLLLLKDLLRSSYILITLFKSFQLVIGFLAMYAIIRELLITKNPEESERVRIEIASFFTGIFYIFSPVMIYNFWLRAGIQQFVNCLYPIVFFLLLKFFKTRKMTYLLYILFIGFIFSLSFSWLVAPYVLSFFSLTFIFLLAYTRFIYKIPIYFKGLLLAGIVFLMLQAFQLLPTISALFNSAGIINNIVFSQQQRADGGLNLFVGVVNGYHRVARSLLAIPQSLIYQTQPDDPTPFDITSFVFPILFLLGLLLSRKAAAAFQEIARRRVFLTVSALFLIALFFATAKITNIGYEFYQSLFNIPGFSMFRWAYMKWLTTYIFFFSLTLGFSLFYILYQVKRLRVQVIVFFVLISIVIFPAFPFINGDIVNTPLYPKYAQATKPSIKMDPNYERMLAYIRNDPYEGRFFSIPYSDFSTPMIAGTEGGVYFGPSVISNLTGRTDINGRSSLLPFGYSFIDLVAKQDYKSIENLLSLLNVRYIFYNSDEAIVKYFDGVPYRGEIRQYFPPDNKTMTEFLKHLSIKEKISFGSKYHIYEFDDKIYLPHIYTATKISFISGKETFYYFDSNWYTKGAFFENSPDYDRRTVFLEEESQKLFPIGKINGQVPNISITKVNPTRYVVHVHNATAPYILVLSDEYNLDWHIFLDKKNMQKLPVLTSYFNNDIEETKQRNIWFSMDMLETWRQRPIAENTHVRANAYANAWYIDPSDVGGKSDYTLILEMTSQRAFYIGLPISVSGFLICLGITCVLLCRNRKHIIRKDA